MAIWSKVLTANPVPADMSEDTATDGYALVKKSGEAKLGWASIPGTYTLPTASSSTKGGVKIGYTENNKNYPVELSSNDKMFVNVPWTDTNTNTFRTVKSTNSSGTTSTLGTTEVLELEAGSNVELTEADGVITISSTDTDTNTFRTVQFTNGATSGTIGSTQTLNLVAGTNVTISESSGAVTFSATDTNTTTTADVKTALNAAMPSDSLTLGDADSTISIPGTLSVATINYDTTNETNLNVTDKTITVADGAGSEAAASGAGLTVDTGETGLIPDFKWYNDSSTKNTSGCIGLGWQLKATNEATTKYHVMGFKTGSGAPTSTTSTTSTKAEGEGAFYWDSTNNNLYVCTDSNSSSGGG
jgi:hypothetical protein